MYIRMYMLIHCHTNPYKATLSSTILLCFPGAIAIGNAVYGEGSGQILLDDVDCVGIENSLLNCHYTGLGSEDCTHSDDAGVLCEGVDIGHPFP